MDIPTYGGGASSNQKVFVDDLEEAEKKFVLVGGSWGENL